MAYYHVLIRHAESPTRYSLLFKDLSEEELRTPFLARFIRGAQGVPEAGNSYASQLWASIIRTETKHDEAVTAYLRDWGEKAEEFMRASGYPVNSQPMGDSAIAGAGQDVTAEFLRPPPGRTAQPSPRVDPITAEIERGRMVHFDSGVRGHDDRVIRTLLKSDLHDDNVKRRFRCLRREARAAERVSHANIVRVLHSGDEDNYIFLATERIDGRDLKSCFDANERFGIGETVIMMGELCAALNAVHEAGIVHCNVTPASVFIEAGGSLKLGDFGWARFDGAEAAENEPEPDPGRTSELIGTPAYMSPEAVSGAVLDRRTDIFSAGAILYQLLTGLQAFAGPGPWTTAKQVLQEDPQFPSLLDEAISPHFDEVVRKALAKDVKDRYQTALELDAALQGAMWKSGPGKI